MQDKDEVWVIGICLSSNLHHCFVLGDSELLPPSYFELWSARGILLWGIFHLPGARCCLLHTPSCPGNQGLLFYLRSLLAPCG